MKKQRVYVDTSVIGGCFDAEFAKWSIGLMRDFSVGNMIPVVSKVVAAEIVDAPVHVREKFSEMVDYGAEVVDVSEEALKLMDFYRKQKILSGNYENDMLHIAIATVAKVDLLVSWNFKHIVHYDKIRQFNEVNVRHGYKGLQIYSPREVTNYEKD
jgi:hypothetical protein